MRVRQYTEIKPLHEAPAGPYVDQGDREEALSDALRGVKLGPYDELIIGWLVRHTDNPISWGIQTFTGPAVARPRAVHALHRIFLRREWKLSYVMTAG